MARYPPSHGTVKLSRVLMSRAMQLLRVGVRSRDTQDIYLILGMVEDLLCEADKLICTLPDEQLFGSHKTFEALTGKRPFHPKAAVALAR